MITASQYRPVNSLGFGRLTASNPKSTGDSIQQMGQVLTRALEGKGVDDFTTELGGILEGKLGENPTRSEALKKLALRAKLNAGAGNMALAGSGVANPMADLAEGIGLLAKLAEAYEKGNWIDLAKMALTEGTGFLLKLLQRYGLDKKHQEEGFKAIGALIKTNGGTIQLNK